MALMCNISCNLNSGGKCLNSVCVKFVHDAETHKKMIARAKAKEDAFYTDKGYSDTITELCQKYDIHRNRFMELLKDGIFWMNAVNICLEERNNERLSHINNDLCLDNIVDDATYSNEIDWRKR